MSRLILTNSLFKGQRTRCRFSVSGCPFQLPSMELHEDRECKYRPTRCPSLTCPVKSPFIKLLRHLEVCTLHKGPFKYCVIMFLTFLGPPTSLMIYSTVNHQKLPFSDPSHPLDDVILEWSLA